jgi:hypothetical protein
MSEARRSWKNTQNQANLGKSRNMKIENNKKSLTKITNGKIQRGTIC